jgi:hypothetical protein
VSNVQAPPFWPLPTIGDSVAASAIPPPLPLTEPDVPPPPSDCSGLLNGVHAITTATAANSAPQRT